ncbi:SIR2 family NAD-dependent protein deacylase [Ferroacidibacillus organovorans]|uniref:protein acetyllysine N-acetyltransferase n=1 Tax=Ferroacidibacillus organovorans TaxID=1765683 RepID=A0A1V4EUI1_9BACL|nr:Sir2 family NAD-dependent protein deacetylase [Ferroacidibacillus organovorans]OPG16596.1 hypothetical protein B2M26_06975 [Ferroacidibacillus organovorans]
MEYNVRHVQDFLKKATRILAITGAGISRASGLPVMSSEFYGIRLEHLFSLEHAQRHQNEFERYYRKMTKEFLHAEPNAAHRTLARHGVHVITQNIDGLDRRAGNKNVIELHGNLHAVRCRTCGYRLPVFQMTASSWQCMRCHGALWPDVVLEGEAVYDLWKAVCLASTCSAALVVGTRLEMSPLVKLLAILRSRHVPIWQINETAEQLVPILFQARELDDECVTLV